MGDTLQKLPPSYLYQQFSDDEDIQATRDAYNALTQEYLEWFNGIGLAVYTSEAISGAFLDWIASGIYGMVRTPIAYGASKSFGPINTYGLNNLTLNTRKVVFESTAYAMTDDIFKRVITWNFYKGDGFQFSIRWLKRRIARFIAGANGLDGPFGDTYAVSVSVSDGKVVVIGINVSSPQATSIAAYLSSLVESTILNLPFGYQWVLNVNQGSSWFGNFTFGETAFEG